MKDISQEVLDKCKEYIDGQLDRLVKKGKTEEPKANFLKTLVTYTLEDEDFEGCDFVIEAVFENMDIKKKVFAAAEANVSETAILATNTSTLSITEMASDLKNPERVDRVPLLQPDVGDAPARDHQGREDQRRDHGDRGRGRRRRYARPSCS